IGPVIEIDPVELQERIERVVNRLAEFHLRLPDDRRSCFELWCHAAIPNSSAILIDERSPDGLIQLETKAYQASLINSYAFEVGSGSEFYKTLHSAYRKLISDGRRVVP